MSKGHLDAAAGGAFLELTITQATGLMDKMLSNQGWGDERGTTKQKGMHTLKEVDMLSAKMDLLMKRLEERSNEKDVMRNPVHAIDSHITCEVCGNIGHSGNDCPETRQDAHFVNNGFRPQGGQQIGRAYSARRLQPPSSNVGRNTGPQDLRQGRRFTRADCGPPSRATTSNWHQDKARKGRA